jgi:hypothetical protein
VKTNNSIPLYWKCQVAGWSIASFYWGYAAFAGTSHFNFRQGIADFILDVLTGILLTHGYRYFSLKQKWYTLKLKALVPRIAPAIFILSLQYMLLIIVKLYLVRLLFNQDITLPFWEFFTGSWLTVFITGTRLMSIWVLAYHLYHYAQREITTAKENARLSIITKEAQLSKLSSQLNPHFFFNSLSNIKFLITENPGSARRAVDLLSDLLRNSLYGKEDQLIPVKEEINLVKDYLELEKLRFEERLRVNIVVGEELAESLVPALSIQALVENAIKHGIEKRKEGGLIEVRVEKKDGFIKSSVQNPGKLGTGTPGGLGLKNLEERLSLQYNGKATFTIEELSGEKILTTILIPIV